MAEAEKKPGFLSKLKRSFADMKGEVKKVVWPSKKQILNNTAIVIGFTVAASVLVGGLDMLLTTLVDLVLRNVH